MAIKTEQGTTEDGRCIYTPKEHESLAQHTDKMGEEDFEDFNRAKVEGRVRDPDSSSEEESASKSMEEMSMDERAKALNGGTSPVRSSDDDRVQRLNRDPGRSW